MRKLRHQAGGCDVRLNLVFSVNETCNITEYSSVVTSSAKFRFDYERKWRFMLINSCYKRPLNKEHDNKINTTIN